MQFCFNHDKTQKLCLIYIANFFVHFFAAGDHFMISTLEEANYISKVNELE